MAVNFVAARPKEMLKF